MTIEAAVALGDGARPHSAAVAPDDATAYVTRFGAGDVAVIDVATLTVTAAIGAVEGPYGVAMSGPRGLNVVEPHSETLFFAAGTVQGTCTVPNAPRGVATSHDGRRLHVTSFFGDALVVVDLAGLR